MYEVEMSWEEALIGKLESRWTGVSGIRMHVRTSIEAVHGDDPKVGVDHYEVGSWQGWHHQSPWPW